MKRRLKDLTKEETIVTLDTLYTASSSIKGRDAMKLFLRDLLTPSERIMLGRRIIIARMLMAGNSYSQIGKRLHVGYATVRRVHKWLEDQFPGFENSIKEMEKEFDRRAGKVSTGNSLVARLKKKYPLHFLLFPQPKNKKHTFGQYPQI
jgi:uncharacterized protein YerC